jgi:UDP-galactopyranose mutase
MSITTTISHYSLGLIGEMQVKYDYVIVRAGLAGSTLAERIASQLDMRVLIIEERYHIGGNTYDHYDEHGILIQKYGPHIFHTSSLKVWEYLSRFTAWNDYEHRVICSVNGKEVYLPITIESLEALYDIPFTPESMLDFLNARKVQIEVVKNSRDVVVSQIGEELYELFFKNYTKKQWGVYPDELDAEVTKRLPLRFNRDTRYFTDEYQGIPKLGYTRMFDSMLNHKNINVLLNTNYKDVLSQIDYSKLIYTGPIDYYFDYKYGKLPYRCLDFDFVYLEQERFQNSAVVNYPNDYDYTRITESKQFYFQKHHGTTLCYEYPKSEGAPYYPIPRQENQLQYNLYLSDAEKLPNVHFIGRLAQYRYMNMDQVVESSLSLFERLRTSLTE